MQIKYIITQNGTSAEELNKTSNTLKTIVATLNTTKDEVATVVYDESKTEEQAINEEVEKTSDSFTHICVVGNGNQLRDHARTTVEAFVKDNVDTVYLPIVELSDFDATKTKTEFKGFLNSSLWKPYFSENVGELDLKLSKRGIDLILDGALIPTSVLKKYPLKTDIKYYSYFEFFNRVLHNEVPILGIPKITLKCIKDYELKSVSREEKIAEFKKAQENYA